MKFPRKQTLRRATAADFTGTPSTTAAVTPAQVHSWAGNRAGLSLATGWTKHGLQFVNTDTDAATVYWPWVLYVADLIDDPIDDFYLWFSTDHHNGAGGIYLATGPTPTGPWTQQGLVYQDAVGGRQTETPSVIWDPRAGALRMYYQQIAATGAFGTQSTLSATSLDGETWTKDADFLIDIPGANMIHGDGHTGYFHPFAGRDGWHAYSLCGGGSGPDFVLWRPATSGLDRWLTDYIALGYETQWTQALGARRVEWNMSFCVSYLGADYLVHMLSNGASGTTPADNRLAVAPISADKRKLMGPPEVIWEPTLAWEGNNLRSSNQLIYNGRVYIYYTIATTHVGVISHPL